MYLGPLGFEVHIQIIIQIGLLLIGSIYLVNLKYRKYLTTWLPQSNKIYYKKKDGINMYAHSVSKILISVI